MSTGKGAAFVLSAHLEMKVPAVPLCSVHRPSPGEKRMGQIAFSTKLKQIPLSSCHQILFSGKEIQV